MKTQSDKLWDLYKERRESGLPVSLSVSFNNGTESFYYSSNPPKPGAADRQKQRRRQRGCRGHGGRARVEKVAGAAKETAAAPSYADVTRTPPSPPQARPMKRARRPSETNNVSHTIQEVAPVRAVDASPKIVSVSGTQKADVAADTVKEIAISADSAAVAAVSSKHSKTKHTMQLRGRSKSLSITSPSPNPTNQATIPPPYSN